MSILENPIPNEVLDNATSPLTDDSAYAALQNQLDRRN